ncbi:hypothetical protein [Microtetraspora niveoalba]|uniref:hypothetical protein n=1 Tax=Microtetraspora niveoalba TaxID=46175 RepID=UPI000836FC78|nr:hypothetical protein [Microtetraspora niveoalba]
MSVHDHLTAAALMLSVARGDHLTWTHRETAGERTYVGAGHDAIARIDDAIARLYKARQELSGELRAEEDERNVRVDALIATMRGERTQASGEQTPGGDS